MTQEHWQKVYSTKEDHDEISCATASKKYALFSCPMICFIPPSIAGLDTSKKGELFLFQH